MIIELDANSELLMLAELLDSDKSSQCTSDPSFSDFPINEMNEIGRFPSRPFWTNTERAVESRGSTRALPQGWCLVQSSDSLPRGAL